MEPFWEPNVHHHSIKYESENGGGYPFCPETGPNFAAGAFSEDDSEFPANAKRVKPTRQDPLSHRIIEKRRRDRMNSCLADLSRLIPPQYQRKSRGRIEKTEIIEMAIKHIKNIQNKENENRQCFQVDQFREGYHECLATAVQFLFDLSTNLEGICLKMVSHLKEHFNEVLKGETCTNYTSSSTSSSQKRRFDSSPTRGNNATMFGSHFQGGSGNNNSRVMHLCGETSSSEAEQLNYAKDLSCRNGSKGGGGGGNPQQTPVITSTASSSSIQSNVDAHLETESSSSTLDHINCPMIMNGEKNGIHLEEAPSNRAGALSKLTPVKVHTLTDTSSCDGEHHLNHYKYKNYIQQRFSQDRYNVHDEHIVSNSSNELSDNHHEVPVNGHHRSNSKPIPPDRDSNDGFAFQVKNGPEGGLKEEQLMNGMDERMEGGHRQDVASHQAMIKPKLKTSKHVPVPIFALHSHGTFYIPLTVDYDAIVPYLGDAGLLDKNVSPVQSLHSVNIHIYTPPLSQCIGKVKE